MGFRKLQSILCMQLALSASLLVFAGSASALPAERLSFAVPKLNESVEPAPLADEASGETEITDGTEPSCIEAGALVPIEWGPVDAGTAAIISALLVKMNDDDWYVRQPATDQLKSLVASWYSADSGGSYELFRSVLLATDWLSSCSGTDVLELRSRVQSIVRIFNEEYESAVGRPTSRIILCAETLARNVGSMLVDSWDLRLRGIEFARFESQVRGCNPISITPSEPYFIPENSKNLDGEILYLNRAQYGVMCAIEEYCI